MKKTVILLSFCFALGGCADLFTTRTFSDEMENNDDNFWVANEDFPVVPGDSGKAYRSRRQILARTPSSVRAVAKEKNQESLESELQEKVNKLSENEYADFMAHSRYLETLSEKIYYLDLPKGQRWQYMADKRTQAQGGSNELEFMKLRQDRYQSYLAVGMTKQEVVGLWGNPQRVEIAGDPRFENERWTFVDQGRVRRVYFENGQVNGWAVQ